MFKINDRVRLKHDNKENPSLTVRSEVGGQRFLCISDCGQRMVWACDHELEMVERNFDLKQAIREVLLSDQFVNTFAGAISSKLQQASVSAEPPRQPAWTPQIGDWVRIRKPSEAKRDGCNWLRKMDRYDGLKLHLDRERFHLDKPAIVYDGFAFPFDWLEPAEQPKAPLNSDTIPEGYRKLKDSSIEPRQVGDLYWSVSKRRYVAIVLDHLPYANRDNWAACRKVEPVIKQSLNTEPPDGWRFLEVGEVIRKGDRCFTKHSGSIDCLTSVGEKFNHEAHYPTIRRNRFEVGEKVVRVSGECVYEITAILDEDYYEMKTPSGFSMRLYAIDLAPYIEETK